MRNYRHWLLICLLAFGMKSVAQQPVGSSPPPETPQPQQSEANEGMTAAFIGYATNRSIVFPDIATNPGPLPVRGKFKLFVNQSISPPNNLLAAFSAGINQARDIPSGYGQGAGAYFGRFGMGMARSSSSSFFSTFLFASMLHQDPRFFPQSQPRLWPSVKYSLRRLVITPTDAGGEAFNYSGVAGVLAGESLANVYLPPSEQTAAKTLTRFGTDTFWRFAGNMFRDYWPVMFRNMGLNRLKGFSDPPSPPPTIGQPRFQK